MYRISATFHQSQQILNFARAIHIRGATFTFAQKPRRCNTHYRCLALQSLAFWMPNYLWNMLHKQTALNPRALVHEARKSRALHGTEREKEVANLAGYIHDTIQVFDPKLRGVSLIILK